MNPYAHGTQNTAATLFAGGVMFILTLSALHSIGLVPDYIDGTGSFGREIATEVLPDSTGHVALNDFPQLGTEDIANSPVLQPMSLLEQEAAKLRAEMAAVAQTAQPEFYRAPIAPQRLVINDVAIDLPVLNPQTTNVEALDEELAKGVVRYPLSAQLNEEGNIFIFGHSSHLPVVHNQMYKALNGIEDLTFGDLIYLEAGGETYVYRVTEVTRTKAEDALIDLSTTQGKRLTISTCDSFGGKSSRWVVNAVFVEVR